MRCCPAPVVMVQFRLTLFLVSQVPMAKNIPPAEVVTLADAITCREGEVVSRTLVQNRSASVTLFAFDRDEGLSTHTAKRDGSSHNHDRRRADDGGGGRGGPDAGQRPTRRGGTPGVQDAADPGHG